MMENLEVTYSYAREAAHIANIQLEDAKSRIRSIAIKQYTIMHEELLKGNVQACEIIFLPESINLLETPDDIANAQFEIKTSVAKSDRHCFILDPSGLLVQFHNQVDTSDYHEFLAAFFISKTMLNDQPEKFREDFANGIKEFTYQ